MMTATAKRIPTIKATSTENFYDVESSNGYDHYPLFYVGPGQVICGCPAGQAGRTCYHRNYALSFMIYIDPEINLRLALLEEEIKEWRQTVEAATAEFELDAVRDLWSEAA